MQQWLSVTTWLLFTFEDQVRCGLECDAVEVRRHSNVSRIVSVLTINNGGHTLQAVFHLLFGTNTML